MKKVKSKSKALSGLVATSLLLLTTIMAFGFLQVWYLNYTDDVTGNLDDEVFPSQVKIEKLEGNLLYVRNFADADLNISAIKIAGVSCNVTGTVINNNLSLLDLADCTDSFGAGLREVALISDKGVFTATKVFKSLFDGEMDFIFSIGSTCPADYTELYGIEDINDSHTELYTENLFAGQTACLKIEGVSLTQSCLATHVATIFYLDNTTNAHVYEINTSSLDYAPYQVCLGSSHAMVSNIEITYSSSDLTSSGYNCIGSMEIDNVLGGHAGDCYTDYTKIWAKVE